VVKNLSSDDRGRSRLRTAYGRAKTQAFGK
jgi:hypothetical protein